MNYLRWIIENTIGIRAGMVLRIVVGLVQTFLGLLLIWLCKQFIDVTALTGTANEIKTMIIVLVAVVLGDLVLKQYYYYLGVVTKTKQTNKLRLRIFNRLMRQRLYYKRPIHSGELVSRLENDIDQVAETVTSLIPDAVVTGIKLLGAFLMMRFMDKTLAWILLILTPLFIVLGRLISVRLRDMTHQIRQQETKIQTTIQESLENNAVLRALESSGLLTRQVNTMQNSLHQKVNKRTKFTVATNSVLAAGFGLGYLFAFVWGGIKLRHGIISLGVMTSFLQLTGQIQHPILELLKLIPKLFHTTASIDRLVELEDLETEQENKLINQPLSAPCGIKFNNITFRYADGDRVIFKNFNYNIKPSQRIAIIGETGAGKTTIFRLLLALANPSEGKIFIYNNQKEEPITQNSRCNMVFVPQGNTLLSGTIRDNLLLANPDANDEMLREVLLTAKADFVFTLPDKLDTLLGERGAGLSEGQAQRIAIARGLLRPGTILLLDEISSALDEETEHQLFANIFSKYPDKTILLITHRKKIASLCDEILNV